MTTFARQYEMLARAGEETALERALSKLTDVVRQVPGCRGVELLRDLKNDRRFLLIEKWESAAAYEQGSALIDKAAFDPVMVTLDGRPQSGSFACRAF
ncbi:hypothetical protein ASE00_09615 [Sphingomonas sp. Root710]|uniref:antibiotic biosynthesis monooxygenase family protein n=1 Tax=Sphingomonas sp. Root710 TaxID=1736594 RepID=UPI0006FB93D7|nr:antibiotic biosynthesis monooxygenase family protein [Sphingomonas sp. Root710]KRB82325.1 hypothetical protein ASE00_09615 [Sphingomonas sp. Root710]